MDNKDKNLLQTSALVIADQIASNIPALNIAWGLSKALYGAGMKLRQEKALEWAEMVQANPEIFTKQLLEQSDFQDGFVFALEKYLAERNKQKRGCFQNIFLGYSQTNNRDDFPMEKLIHTPSQLNEGDILVLKDVDVLRQDKNYQIYGDTEKNITNIFNLITAGILHSDPSPRIGPIIGPFIWVSDFGKEFIKYLIIKNE
jgi:hypothetical protein